MDWIRIIRLKVPAPFLRTDGVYVLNDMTAEAYYITLDEWQLSGRDTSPGRWIGPLRNALSGMLWLMATEPDMVEVLTIEPAD